MNFPELLLLLFPDFSQIAIINLVPERFQNSKSQKDVRGISGSHTIISQMLGSRNIFFQIHGPRMVLNSRSTENIFLNPRIPEEFDLFSGIPGTPTPIPYRWSLYVDL